MLAMSGSHEIEDKIDIKAEEILRYPDMDLQTVARGYETLNSSQRTVLEKIEFAVTQSLEKIGGSVVEDRVRGKPSAQSEMNWRFFRTPQIRGG